MVPANPTKMDQNEDHKLQAAEKFSFFQLLKRTLMFVFTVSVFSSFVWYSSGFSILPQSFNAYFSTFFFSMFTHTLERKYMFVIFNGILAFLVKSSVFTSPSISASNIEIPLSLPSETKIPAYDQEVVVPSRSTFESPESASLMPEEEEEEELEQASEAEEREGGVNEASIVEEEDYEGEKGSEVSVKQEDEADAPLVANEESDNADEESDNADELNRKFEEFIRKMKEEIRIEAQRQLISV